MDIILRDCGRSGWLAIIEMDDKEMYRGERQNTIHEALFKAQVWLSDWRHNNEMCTM